LPEAELVIPGPPVPKGRPRKGKGRWYTPRSTIEFEEHVAWVARAQRTRFGDDPVRVSIEIWTQRSLRGDLDNYAKSILDGLQKGGLFNNDRQVVGLDVQKVTRSVTGEDRTRVVVRSI
jgi:crossover junction endodeoxyribonuclease RusA